MVVVEAAPSWQQLQLLHCYHQMKQCTVVVEETHETKSWMEAEVESF